MKKNKSLAITILMITMLIILSTKVQASTGTVEGETVNVRKETNTKSTVLTQLDKGQKVEILEEVEDWYKIETTEKNEKITGYVSSKYINVPKEQTVETKPETETPVTETPIVNNTETVPENNNNDEQIIEGIKENTEYDITQEVKIRLLPLMNSIEKDSASSGKITIKEIINDWCKIENDSVSGWIRTNSLKKALKGEETSEPTETPTSTETPTEEKQPEEKQPEEKPETQQPRTTNNDKVIKKGYVSTESLRVRKEASQSSKDIDSLKKNDEVSILEELDGWYKIKIEGGVGYVSSKYISDTKVAETTSRSGSTIKTPTGQESEEKEKTESQDEPEDSSTSTATGEAVVEYAKKYLGYKYVSGGASPDAGFDCSGFTSYVYKHFGVTLSRSSRSQINNGPAVEKSNLKIGDIVVFNNDANTVIGHLGIYIGGGEFIHASNPKDGVKITALSSSYYSARYVGARRVI